MVDSPIGQQMARDFAARLKAARETQARALPPAADPLARLRYFGVTPWSDVGGYLGDDKVAMIANHVMSDGSPNRFTVVESGNGVGKSLTAAAITCSWLCDERYEEAAVITLAPTWSQVNNVLWRHIRAMYRKAGGALPGTVYETPRWDVNPRKYAIGLSPRRASAEDLQALHGYHNPRLLVIMDEAPGLPRLLWEAVNRLVTAPGNKVLCLGNPIQQAGPFWEACNSPNWNYVNVSCLDHPNVKLCAEVIPGATGRDWVLERIRDHCTRAAAGDPGAFEFEGQWWQPDGVFQSMVLGKAPSEASDQLIPLAWVSGAMTWTAEPAKDERIVLGLDPSRVAHGDAAAMVCRQGGLVKWVKRSRCKTNDPTGELAGWLRGEHHREGASRCYIEETGVGAGVVDRARSLGLPVVAVSPGSGASHHNFANKRAECWWRLREALQGGAMSLPQDDLLAGDLTALKFYHDGQGRILMEPKDKIRERLGRSPDSGDALSLTYALEEHARRGGADFDPMQGLTGVTRWGTVPVVPASADTVTPKPGRAQPGRWSVGSGRRRF